MGSCGRATTAHLDHQHPVQTRPPKEIVRDAEAFVALLVRIGQRLCRCAQGIRPWLRAVRGVLAAGDELGSTRQHFPLNLLTAVVARQSFIENYDGVDSSGYALAVSVPTIRPYPERPFRKTTRTLFERDAEYIRRRRDCDVFQRTSDLWTLIRAERTARVRTHTIDPGPTAVLAWSNPVINTSVINAAATVGALKVTRCAPGLSLLHKPELAQLGAFVRQ